MRRPCEKCGSLYEAQRATSKFCSAKCRVAAGRAGEAGAAPSNDGVASRVTRDALAAAGRDATYLGGVALVLADRLDSTPGSGAAALAKELRATMDAALEGTRMSADEVDEFTARRDAKRRTAG